MLKIMHMCAYSYHALIFTRNTLINSLGSFQWYDRVDIKGSGGQFYGRLGCQ
jgi:hypothetical protein